jgi:hypothetical protein
MNASATQRPDHSSAAAARETAGLQLLMDQFLPRYDLAVAHAHVFRASPAECYWVASELESAGISRLGEGT